MLWQAIVIFVSVGIAVVAIRRFAIPMADERAERERQRNVREAITAKKLSDVAKRLRLTYVLDEKPSVSSPPLNLVAQTKTKPTIESKD
jgi:hypothetical protein